MRPTRFLLLGTLFALTLTLAQAQPPGFSGRSRGGFGGGPPDPERIWEFMGGKGKESIDLNADPKTKERMVRMGATVPPNGILTKEQFKADYARKVAEREASGGRGGPPSATPAPGGDPGSDWLTTRFKQSDRNNDGYLTVDEASDQLKPVFAQADTNRDGKLDADEYRTYVTTAMQSRGSSSPSQPPGGTPYQQPDRGRDRKDDDDEPRPRVSVSRYGKLPKEVPGYFTEIDDDRDGMVGLYEWRRHERKTAEFVEMDLNKDGYLTADEWLRYNRFAIEKRERESTADDGPLARSPSSSRTAAAETPPAAKPADKADGKSRRTKGKNPFIVEK